MSAIANYHNPSFYNPEFGDFKTFYIIIAIITIVASLIFLLNFVLGCCSRHSEYWSDRHTGNRWIISLWTSTPHNQPALDYSELGHYVVPKVVIDPQKHPFEYSNDEFQPQPEVVPTQYFEMKKRESDI